MPSSIVVVTEPEFRRGETVFGSATAVTCIAAPSAEDALVKAIVESHARHAVVGSIVYRGELYSTLPRGGVLARFGVGHDTIDKDRATDAGLLCTNTPEVLDQSVAELTILLIVAAARHLTGIVHDVQRGVWQLREGAELQGKTLAIIGAGRIGRAVARIASGGFGMRVIGCRRSASTQREGGSGDFDRVTSDFAEAVRNADYVSLHIPAIPENAHFINRERLSLLQERAWLINTARGAVVDEVALYDALTAERIGGAALDVFECEPYEPVDPARDLRTLAHVITTPHVGSHTAEANRRMAQRALQNIVLAEAGDYAAMDLLNPGVLRATP